MTDAQEIIAGLLSRRTPVSFRAGGPSMNPAIRDGETVHVRPLQAGDPRPGAVVLHRKTARLVLHRLVRRDPRTGACFIAADAALAGGDQVPAADILGVAEWVRRGERIRRLDGPASRMAGRIRHALRPLRRALMLFRPPGHAHAPANRS